MTTYELPPEPPIGTRLVDKQGRTWTQECAGWWAASGVGVARWSAVLRHGPLAEVPAPALPTEDGALIIASGTSDGEPFENKVLVRRGAGWRGDVATGGVSPGLVSFDDEITSWVEAVAVPKAECDVLREEVRSVVASAGAGLDPDPYIASKARKLIDAADGAA